MPHTRNLSERERERGGRKEGEVLEGGGRKFGIAAMHPALKLKDNTGILWQLQSEMWTNFQYICTRNPGPLYQAEAQSRDTIRDFFLSISPSHLHIPSTENLGYSDSVWGLAKVSL